MSSQQEHINDAIEDSSVRVTASVTDEQADVLTPGVLRFVAALTREFEATRLELLRKREIRQREIEDGRFPDFLAETRQIRMAKWAVAPIPNDLADRRVEISRPAHSTMLIDSLHSGANVCVADFEDSIAPTWHNSLQGQVNLLHTINGSIALECSVGVGDRHTAELATLMVRPRGWHLVEKHVTVDGKPVAAALFDFGVFFFNNARALIESGTAPYLYLPKIESHLEARLWNDVFNLAQDALGIRRGTIRATVLIETILAAFEMDEILFELRHHSSGLAHGRWDYIFSFIKRFRNHPEFVLPDRHLISMEHRFLSSCAGLMIDTCHRRSIHAIGGMTPHIPIHADPLANAAAVHEVRNDKLREVKAGHDGTWVADPDLVAVAREVFDAHMKTPNQIQKSRDKQTVSATDLLTVPDGDITETGLQTNIHVGLLYLESWLRGNGCVAIHNLIEDTATAETSRSLVWQWVQHRTPLNDGRAVSRELVEQMIAEELQGIRENIGDKRYESGRFDTAAEILGRITTGDGFPPFMSLVGYDYLD
jgi:malate synthase